MATNVSEWRNLVSANSEGKTGSEIDVFVIRTLRDFCERTSIWKDALTAISIVDGTAGYALTHATADICKVYKATVDGNAINPVTEEWLDTTEPEWRNEAESYPTRYYVTPNKYIYLVYEPDLAITSGLVVYVTMKPKLTATTVEDFLFNEHGQTIADGATARILRVSQDRRENIQLAEYFDKQYEGAVFKATMGAAQGLSRASLKGRNFFF